MHSVTVRLTYRRIDRRQYAVGRIYAYSKFIIYLFYYENRTQGTLKTIKKNKEQSTTG